MSGNSYQKYKMQRIGKPLHSFEYSGKRSALTESIRVSEVLGLKIRNISAKTRLPNQVIAAEAISRGFEMLSRNTGKFTSNDISRA